VTLSFPQTMPMVGVMSNAFEPQRVDFLSPEAGGRLGAISAGMPLWTLALNLNNMRPDDADIWTAFLDTQRGAQRQWYGFDPDRRVPRVALGGRPFTAAPSSWSQTIADDGTAYLTLRGLMPGEVISRRDYVGFAWDGWKRSLTRSVEQVSADASGSATFAVEPPLTAVTPLTATATLKNPTCLMRLDTKNTKLGQMAIGYMASGGAIAAVQDLVP
jgi:hypothetical protein